MFDLKGHLKQLVEAHAPSGHEGPIREIVRETWKDLVDEFQQDGLGSLVGIKRATDPTTPTRKIMLAAHMDEIGLMVRDIVDGFIFVHRISGIDNRVMLSQPVIVHGQRPLKGVVAATPPHLLAADERKKYPTMNDLVIDVGLPADEVAELVNLGDLITPDVAMIELQGKKLAAKAFDDRACVAAVTACLDALNGMKHQWDVYATATVQEETGLKGATTAAELIAPDVAIALDVCFAAQPGVSQDDQREMGKGPVLGIGPNFHIKLSEQIKATAQQHEIKLQYDPIPGRSGTDAWAIQVAQSGIPTVLISIAIRNMHSPVETLDLQDIERAGRLLAHFIAGLDGDFLNTIEWDSTQPTEEAEA